MPCHAMYGLPGSRACADQSSVRAQPFRRPHTLAKAALLTWTSQERYDEGRGAELHTYQSSVVHASQLP